MSYFAKEKFPTPKLLLSSSKLQLSCFSAIAHVVAAGNPILPHDSLQWDESGEER